MGRNGAHKRAAWLQESCDVLDRSAVFGDVLRIELAPTEWSSVGFDLLYRATNAATGDEIARARTGMVFFDYAARKLARVPAGVREKMERVTAGG